MSETLLFRPATIQNFVTGLKKVAKWFHYHLDEERYPYLITDKQWSRFMDVAGNIGNIYRREAKKELMQHSMEKCVENQELPPNGQQGLLTAIQNVTPWVQSFDCPNPPYITKMTYVNMQQNLFASFYACSPQGRIGGIMSLKYKHASKLLSRGHILATEFKTATSYITQPVILMGEAILFFRVYMEVFRPIAAAAYAQRNYRAMNQPDDPLFITFNGLEETRAGRYTKQFFIKNCELTTTTNKARGLIETVAEDLQKVGDISGIARDGIGAISGHSTKIFKAHYHQRSRERDVEGAKEVMGVIRGHYEGDDLEFDNEHYHVRRQQHSNATAQATATHPEYEEEIGHSGNVNPRRLASGQASYPPVRHPNTERSKSAASPMTPHQRHNPAPQYQPRVWGRLHPDFNKPIRPNSRYVWSDAELDYIRQYVERSGGPDSHMICARMLKYIKTTGFAEAQDIFHAKHVLTCDRLHHGIRSVFGDRKRKVVVDDDDDDYDEWQESEEQSNEELV